MSLFNPKNRILVTSEYFKDEFVCSGPQLISVVESVKGRLPSHIWYGADIETVGKGASYYNLERIGSDSELIEYCSKVDQFFSGVFLYIDSRFESQNFQEIVLETEDPPYRPINCKGVLLEIRAFDTSYFEIYSEEEISVLKKI